MNLHREFASPAPVGSGPPLPMRAFACGALVALLAVLPACADMAPEYNPIEYGRSVSRGVSQLFSDKPAEPDRPTTLEPPPAEGRPFPNLATVPKPPRPTPAAERQADVAQLMADHSQAIAADRALREGMPAAPPAPPVLPPRAVIPAPPAAPAAAPRAAPAKPVALGPATPGPGMSGVSIYAGTIAFDGDSIVLSDSDRRQLAEIAQAALAQGGRVRIAGSAPDRGDWRLAQARAEVLTQELIRLGVSAGRMAIASAATGRMDVFVDY